MGMCNLILCVLWIWSFEWQQGDNWFHLLVDHCFESSLTYTLLLMWCLHFEGLRLHWKVMTLSISFDYGLIVNFTSNFEIWMQEKPRFAQLTAIVILSTLNLVTFMGLIVAMHCCEWITLLPSSRCYLPSDTLLSTYLCVSDGLLGCVLPYMYFLFLLILIW